MPIRRTADASRRISDQRTDALTQANVIRERRAALKRRLRDGEEWLATLILDPPDYLHTARIEMLIMTTPGLGRVRSHNLLRDVGIPAKTTIGRLSERQRTMLASKLPAPAPPAGRPGQDGRSARTTPTRPKGEPMTTPAPPVTDHDQFERQLLELRKREKAHTREGDAIAAARRRLPMTEVPPDTTVIGPDGPVPFGDVFEGRDELIVYSHMFHDGKPWESQCEGCTRNSWPMQHAADAAYLNANGITFAILGDGPYEEIAAFREFMGYTTPWYSNAHLDHPTVGVAGRISCYLRREGRIYLTYWTTGRGDEVMSPSYGLLDLTAYGRREQWEDSPEGWPQLPTHSVMRTDEHGTPVGVGGGRPVVQWTRPGATAVGAHTG